MASSLPDPALPAPPLSNDDQGFTADQLITRQLQLEEAAREAVPFSFTKGGCTYGRGYIRQPVFACRTCGGGGVCAGCSVGCHAEHELVELFAKRRFRCDCGTLSLCRGDEAKEKGLSPCNLREKELKYAPQNDDNLYGKNFAGQFCRCERGKTYDAEVEDETMFQCLCCEDWLHESCTSLRPSRDIDDIDVASRRIADGPLIHHESFEHFICNECVRKPGNEVLKRYLGHKGWSVCIPTADQHYLPKAVDEVAAIPVLAKGEDWSQAWNVYGLIGNSAAIEHSDVAAPTRDDSVKRKADESQEVQDRREAKRIKSDNGLPASDSFSDVSFEEGGTQLDSIVVQPDDETCVAGDVPLFAAPEAKPARLDVFLTESFRERLCRCKYCLPDYVHFPFLLETEQTYSPPRSHNPSEEGSEAQSEGGASQTSSTYDLGLAALQRLPRAQMMESLEAYNRMRDALFSHLRPFAEQGRVVDGESLREFFRKQREEG